MKDILYTNTGDIKLTGGDIQWGESTAQHQYDLLKSRPGDNRLSPGSAIDAGSYVNDDGPEDLFARTRTILANDGMKLTSIALIGTKLKIVAAYPPGAQPNKSAYPALPIDLSRTSITTVAQQSLVDLGLQGYGNADAIRELLELNDLAYKMNQDNNLVPEGEVDLAASLLPGITLNINPSSTLMNRRNLKALQGLILTTGLRIAVVPRLIDDYPAYVAYSLRKLSAVYTGKAVRIRRSSDNTEQDIGFTPQGDFDIQAFNLFVGAGNGFVVKWYDQSGKGKDLAQSTANAQPRLVANQLNGKPAIVSDGVNDWLSITTLNLSRPWTIKAVGKVTGGTGEQALMTAGPSAGVSLVYRRTHVSANVQFAGIFYKFPTAPTEFELSSLSAGTATSNYYRNGVLAQTVAAPAALPNITRLFIFSEIGLGQYAIGAMTELVIWDADMSGNQTIIDNDINTYYAAY